MELKIVLNESLRVRGFAGANGSDAGFIKRMQPVIERAAVFSREATRLFKAFLEPVSLVALAFGLWRLCADLGWTGEFVIERGLFSHWQVWIALAIGIKMSGSLVVPAIPAENEHHNPTHKAQL